MLIEKLKIDVEKIKQRNNELISKNWIDGLSVQQKKFLNFRKGPPSSLMNRYGLFGYTDLSNFLINPDKFNEIRLSDIQAYMTIFELKQKWDLFNVGMFNDDFTKILQQIQKKRIKNIIKYIELEDSIFKKGIYANDTIYRIQDRLFENNIIKNSTSWSLTPQEFFCSKSVCHIYITKIPLLLLQLVIVLLLLLVLILLSLVLLGFSSIKQYVRRVRLDLRVISISNDIVIEHLPLC